MDERRRNGNRCALIKAAFDDEFVTCVVTALAFCCSRWRWPFRLSRRREPPSWLRQKTRAPHLQFVFRPAADPLAIKRYRAGTNAEATPAHSVRLVAPASRLLWRGPALSAWRPSSGSLHPGRRRTAPCRLPIPIMRIGRARRRLRYPDISSGLGTHAAIARRGRERLS
jgi:hypothetical protein